ncbi:MAG: hypothetical protein HY894_04185 [Deltaproteobacteria bacterium]|nr:hypothetical protein [Deltaproteobacteria bacterium]
MKKTFIAAIIVAALWAAPSGAAAEGADWRFIQNSGDNSIIYYDAESVVAPVKNTADVWTRLEVRGKVYSMTLFEVSCADRRLRTLIKYGFDNAANAVIDLPGSDDAYPTRWTYIVPETFEAKLAKAVCAKIKEKEGGN